MSEISTKKPTREFKGIWIPEHIWLSKDLKPMEKLLLAEINSLDGANGCWAGNAHFQELFDVSDRYVREMISRLKSLGFISIANDSTTKFHRVIHVESKAIKAPKKGGTTAPKGGTTVPHGRNHSSAREEPQFRTGGTTVPLHLKVPLESSIESSIQFKENELLNERTFENFEQKNEPLGTEQTNDFTTGAATIPNLFFSERFPNFQTLESECLKNCKNTEGVDFAKAFAKWERWASKNMIRMENWFLTIQKFLDNEATEKKLQKAKPVPGVKIKKAQNTEGSIDLKKFRFDYENLFTGTFEEFERRVESIANLMPLVVASGFVIDDYEKELDLWTRCKETTSEKRKTYFDSQCKAAKHDNSFRKSLEASASH
jgi:hypothetical protein